VKVPPVLASEIKKPDSFSNFRREWDALLEASEDSAWHTPIISSDEVTYHKANEVEGGLVFCDDAVNLLKSLPDESIDLCIFDPAYESLEKHRRQGTTTRLKHSKASSNDWFATFPNTSYFPLFEQLYRVMKKGTHVYMFCDEETRDVVVSGTKPQEDYRYPWDAPPIAHAGFKYWKAVVWDKIHAGIGYHFRASYEFVLMLEKVERKGKHRKVNDLGPRDVQRFQRLKGPKFYPTEKPIGLMKLLIQQSTNVGDTVLDMFAGSGVVGQACVELDRRFILGDLKIDEIMKRLG